jgi:hypothetical protein
MGHNQQRAAEDLETAAGLGSHVSLEQPVKFLERMDVLVAVEEEDGADGRPDVGSMSSCQSTVMQQLGVDHGVNQENYEDINLGSLGIINTETKRASIVRRRRRTWTRW